MINQEYFNYLVDNICDGRCKYYTQLLETLYDTEFISNDIMDDCRISDGYRFRDLYFTDYGVIDDPEGFVSKPCSILEMLVSFCIRIEKEILFDNNKGDRSSFWFWKMIGNMGLLDMDDGRFDHDYVVKTLDIFNERGYKKDGLGGLFYIPGCKKDLRKLDIWSQMCLFFNENKY